MGRTREWVKQLAANPALLVLLAFHALLRVYRITAPPVDFQAWRCTATLMIARNFYRDGMNPFLPRVDWFDSVTAPGSQLIAGTEFMATPYLIAILYGIFGLEHWVGRLVPVLFSLVGLYFFFRLACRLYDRTSAIAGTLLLGASPYYLYCGRCPMPESFAIAMSIGALLYFDEWLALRTKRTFGLAVLTTVLMLLGKPQLGVMIVPFAFLTFYRLRAKAFRDVGVYAFVAMVFVPVLAYAWWSWGVLSGRTAISWGDGSMHFAHGRWLTDFSYYAQIIGSVWWWSVTPLVCLLAVLALALPWMRRQSFGAAWLAGALALFVVMPGACQTNGYYQIILEAPFALLAGVAVANLSARGNRFRVLAACVVVGAMANSLVIANRMYRPDYEALRRCGEWLRDNTAENARILVAEQSSVTLYFADRKGWTSWPASLGVVPVFNAEFVNRTGAWGASVVAVPHDWFNDGYYRDFDGIRDMLYDSFRCAVTEDFTAFLLTAPPDLALPPEGRVEFGSPPARKYLRGTWGPDQRHQDGTPFTTLGPGKVAQIRFLSARGVTALVLDAASPVADQEISVRVNDGPELSVPMADANVRRSLAISDSAMPGADGAYTVTIGVTRQDNNAVGLVLYGLRADQD